MDARGIGGGKAIGLMRGGVEAGAQRAEEQQQERSRQHRQARDQAGKHAQKTEPACSAKRRPNALASIPTGSVPIHMPTTMTLIGSVASIGSGASSEPAMPAGRHDHGIVAAGQRLRRGQHQRIARGQPVVGDLDCCVG